MTQTVVRFFFQAEDGIRDGRVTGVQTCALPISFLPMHSILRIDEVKKHGPAKITVLEGGANVAQFPMPMYSTPPGEKKRSEERRVGKECRSRWWRYHEE